MQEKTVEQAMSERLLGGKTVQEVIQQEAQKHVVKLESEAAKWLTEKLQSGEDNTSDYPVAAQRALFVKGALDTLAGNVDYVLSQAVVEYFHGSTFAAQIKKAITSEAVKRFPNKNAFPEGFPDIKGKLVEDKEV
jgi:hypothetical protein